MSISPESKLGPYEILSLLGAGGMGEVYRARDPRLNREVAIKVLPPDRMADENRRRRFIQEARAASALNHPNIVTIYEIDAVDGIDFIVMEYVPGKTLDALIPRQGMRPGDVLRIAMPVADALAQAHGRGIVHRDLKPGNVMVSDEGVAKVLDFGLAKLVSSEEPNPEPETRTKDTTASELSRPGTIAGTAGYMSPEQATGGKVDSRSDVFSFGAMLYEMVTGRQAFARNSTADTLAAVVREQPKAPSDLVLDLPRDLEKLILRCLRKEVDRRFQHMLDVKLELEQITEESSSGPGAAVPARSKRGRWWVAGVAGLLAIGALGWLRQRPPLPPPRTVSLTSMRGTELGPSLSPDGEQVAFAWDGEKLDNFDIYIKGIGSPEMRRLTTDPALDWSPSWSPDGRQIAFTRFRPPDGCTIHLVSPLGGPGSERKLGDFLTAGGPPSWSPDGRWLAVARARIGGAPNPVGGPGSEGIYLVPVEGGEPRPIPLPQAAGDAFSPRLSPDGRRLGYTSCAGFSCHVDVVELGDDFIPRGPPRRLTRRPIYPYGGFAWTRDGGSLLFVEYGIHRLWRVAYDGNEPPAPIDLAGLGVLHPRTAASRDRLVFVKERADTDIYQFFAGRPAEPVLASSFADYNPHFSPDGRRVAFESERSGESHEIWLAEADGTRPVPLTRGPGLTQGAPRWSPDGRRIAFESQAEDGHWDIWTIDVDGGTPRRLTLGPGDENAPSWSHDGLSVYFASRREGGAPDVWRIPAAGGMEERMTHGGGTFPDESRDGHALLFMKTLTSSPLMTLPLGGGPERQLVECVSAFAVGPDGLYYLGCQSETEVPLFMLDSATGRERPLGKLSRAGGLTVSPHDKTILFTKGVGEGSDLMMIENFR